MKKAIIIFGFVLLAMLSGVFADTWNNTEVNSIPSNITIVIDDAIQASSVDIGTNYITFFDFSFNDSRVFTVDGTVNINSLLYLNFTTSDFTINTSELVNVSGHLVPGTYAYVSVGNLTIPSEITKYNVTWSDYMDCENINCSISVEGKNILFSNQMIKDGTTTSDVSFTNQNNMFDFNKSSYAQFTWANVDDHYIGKTFSETYVSTLDIKAGWTSLGASNRTIYLENYDGSSWNIIAEDEISSTARTWDTTIVMNDNSQGLRFRWQTSNSDSFTARAYYINVTQLNYTFESNGNKSYTFYAENETDFTNITSKTLINPYFLINFDNGTSLVSNFTINGTTYNNTFIENIYDYGLGVHDFVFNKDGYIPVNFTLNFTNTSLINATYSLLPATVLIYLYDDVNKSLITGHNFTLSLKGPTSTNKLYTTTGMYNVSGVFAQGDYEGLLTSTPYESKEIFFEFSNQEEKRINVYFIELNNSNLGYVTIKAYEADNSPYQNIAAYAKQWFPESSAYIKVQETRTGTDGQAELKILLEDSWYLFCIETDNGETCVDEGIVKTTENGKEVTIVEDIRIETPTNVFGNLEFTPTSIQQLNFSSTTRAVGVNFDWDSSDGSDEEICVVFVKDYNYTQEVVAEDCVTASSGTFQKIYVLNSTNSYDLKIKGKVLGTTQTVYADSFEGTEDIRYILSLMAIKVTFAVIILAVSFAVIAMRGEPVTAIVIVLADLFVFNWLLGSVIGYAGASGIVVICGLAAWGMRRI